MYESERAADVSVSERWAPVYESERAARGNMSDTDSS